MFCMAGEGGGGIVFEILDRQHGFLHLYLSNGPTLMHKLYQSNNIEYNQIIEKLPS